MPPAYTRVVGLEDLSLWRVPYLNRYVDIFLVPFTLPILLLIMTVGLLRNVEPRIALPTLCLISLGLFSQYWLLIKVSGYKSFWSTLLCMLVIRSLLAHPFFHVNIFQHMEFPMFSPGNKPQRIHTMSLTLFNLPCNPILDWTFGHSVINCHVEHHLFPLFSDNMCLKVKPVVSQFLQRNHLPYNEDSYLSRLGLLLSKYEEILVHAPPITDLVGLQ
ncbi:LOW QUALITY PROTEIN: fatty acid desaturase 6-like [Dromiciops gliroides]|uniref:LOW QUALITY PROTEIN: fatty acid desaturase 6-like n=1 Tax=Dromiciops gliroides TaxID=33562 RepID=UPI001CC4686E|nr:LOW QUALITY PROTEIN: fatty acid desaturase 6-like [Dromiciops gliroides]